MSNATLDNEGPGGNTAVHINGADNSFVSFGTQIGQFGISDFTLAFWLQTTESHRYFDIAGNRAAGSHGNFFCIRMTGKHESRPGGIIASEVDQDQNGTNYIGVESKTAGFNDGKWHHLAVVRQGTSLKLYIDGVISGNATGNGVANIANGNAFKLGRSLVGVDRKFAPDARYSGLRVYDTALNDSEISSLFSTATATKLPTNSKIKLKSWKGDYLHRPDTAQGVTTWNTGIGNEWIVELISTVEQTVVNTKNILVGIGMNNQLFTRKTLTSNWEYIPNSGAVLGITVMADGTIVGIGMNNQLFTRKTLTSNWEYIPNSGAVLGVASAQESSTVTNPPAPKSLNGQIVINADEWTLSDQGIKAAPDGATFALNVAKYFLGDNKGKFHVLSNNFGLTGASLANTMANAGHTWTKGINITVNLTTLQQYDGIFIGGNPVDNQVLIEYVKNGGKVYLCAGTGQGGAQVEANNWNTFLAAFGLQYQGIYNGISANVPVNNPNHPLFTGVKTLYQNNGNSITDLQPNSPLNHIILAHSSGQGLIATAEFIKPSPESVAEVTPEPSPESVEEVTPEPSPESVAETLVSDAEEFTITVTKDVTISRLVYKGEVKRTQADEYIEISNLGNSTADISGWKITSAGSAKQVFTFPQGTILEGGKNFRVYTNQEHSETGGFSFGSKTAIWNDAGDEAKLFDAEGSNVSTLAYGKNTIGGIKKELKVPQLQFIATHAAINKQMSLGGKVTFTQALSSAIKSFIEDDSDVNSPLAQILNQPHAFGFADGVTQAIAGEKVRSLLNEGGVLSLYPTAENTAPANGETVDKYWIFALSLGLMGETTFWAIVPRSGEPTAYNYSLHK
ncbi:lamin tail domain-containing protein [Nodularia spumigena CS-588/06]|uniref:lamin tail domain-containing protein n=1 Tax=Nodularia spumigena TaxID=70799 RepID=UPI00232B354C|nr:lamin tail domain-containing protein [Nodularia spumigena]MDB9344115.1 lamin tail domain-containing protein [Nodularia spumigena CS-588/06]